MNKFFEETMQNVDPTTDTQSCTTERRISIPVNEYVELIQSSAYLKLILKAGHVYDYADNAVIEIVKESLNCPKFGECAEDA